MFIKPACPEYETNIAIETCLVLRSLLLGFLYYLHVYVSSIMWKRMTSSFLSLGVLATRFRVVSIGRLTAFYVVLVPVELIPSMYVNLKFIK